LQYKVPQNVQIEDKILPFMTLRQLMICGGGGGLAYIVYLLLEQQPSSIWMPPVIFFVLITIAIAFLQIRGIPFVDFILLLLERYLNETKRVWVKSAGDFSIKLFSSKKQNVKNQKNEIKKTKKSFSIQDVRQLSKMLDKGMES
jgi:hypothetical protein